MKLTSFIVLTISVASGAIAAIVPESIKLVEKYDYNPLHYELLIPRPGSGATIVYNKDGRILLDYKVSEESVEESDEETINKRECTGALIGCCDGVYCRVGSEESGSEDSGVDKRFFEAGGRVKRLERDDIDSITSVIVRDDGSMEVN